MGCKNPPILFSPRAPPPPRPVPMSPLRSRHPLGAHPTRGASVKGLFANVWQWGSLDAFSKYYLRLKAMPQASVDIMQCLQRFREMHANVHNDSLGSSPLSELSRSPHIKDRGRKEGEDEAQDASDTPVPTESCFIGRAPHTCVGWSVHKNESETTCAATYGGGATTTPTDHCVGQKTTTVFAPCVCLT